MAYKSPVVHSLGSSSVTPQDTYNLNETLNINLNYAYSVDIAYSAVAGYVEVVLLLMLTEIFPASQKQ